MLCTTAINVKDTAYCYKRSGVVCMSVCLFGTPVSCAAKTAEPIKIRFGDKLASVQGTF